MVFESEFYPCTKVRKQLYKLSFQPVLSLTLLYHVGEFKDQKWKLAGFISAR